MYADTLSIKSLAIVLASFPFYFFHFAKVTLEIAFN